MKQEKFLIDFGFPMKALSKQDDNVNWKVWIFLVIAIVVSAIIISSFTKPIIYDQEIAKYRFDNGYPSITSGIVSHLVIGTYNLVVNPSDTAQNIHIKTFSMILFYISAFLLAFSILKNRFLAALFLVLLFVSRYPFLWLSTELLVASFLFLAIWSMVNEFHPLIVSLFLVLCCFSKPELIVVVLGLMVYYGVKLRRQKKSWVLLIIGFMAFSFLAVSPGLIKRGGNFFSGNNRSLFSFGQHYAALFFRHQASPNPPDPWDDYYRYIQNNFKGAENMVDVVLKYPFKYFDYLLLSFGRGMQKAIVLFHILWIIIAMMLYRYLKDRITLSTGEKLMVISFIGYLPFILFSFPHIRYLARYFPLVLVLLLKFLNRLAMAQNDKSDLKENNIARSIKPSRLSLITVSAAIFLFILIDVFLFAHNIAGFETVKEFWFPD